MPFFSKAKVSSDRNSDVSSLEKEKIEYLEHGPDSDIKQQYLQHGLSNEDAEYLLNMPLKDQNKIFHKVDKRVVPMLALLYL